MADELDGLLTRLSENAPTSVGPAPLTDSDKELLEALGYLSAGGGGGGEKTGNVDPKDHVETIHLYAEYQDALNPLDNDRLITILERMVELEPEAALPLVTLGTIYENAGNYEKSETYLKKAVEFNPDCPEAKINLAKTYILTGNYDPAKELLDAVFIDPNATPINLAKAYVSTGELVVRTGGTADEAAEYYKAAIEQHRDFPKPYYELARLYGGVPGGDEKAKEYACRFLELDPRGERAAWMRAVLGQEPVEILFSKGKRAYLERDFDEAAEYFRRAREQDPSYYEARYNLACCLARAGRPDEATAELQRLVRDQPGVFDEAITRDPDLDSLRGREDFKRLLE
jgi:tetratricopeptide (TPR) repeat protein